MTAEQRRQRDITNIIRQLRRIATRYDEAIDNYNTYEQESHEASDDFANGDFTITDGAHTRLASTPCRITDGHYVDIFGDCVYCTQPERYLHNRKYLIHVPRPIGPPNADGNEGPPLAWLHDLAFQWATACHTTHNAGQPYTTEQEDHCITAMLFAIAATTRTHNALRGVTL